MKIKRIIIAIAAMLVVVVPAKSAVFVDDVVEVPFASYAKYTNGAFGVDLQMPNSFTDGKHMGKYQPVLPNGDIGIVWTIGAILQSGDGQCAVLMPDMFWRGHDLVEENVGDVSDFTQCETYWAVKGGVWYEYLQNHKAIDMTKYERSIDASPFRADTAVLVTLPANDTIMGQHYTHRNFLVLKKANRPVVLVNVFFTDKGAKVSDKYLKNVFAAVKYSDEANWQFNQDVAKKLRNECLKDYLDYYGKFLR